MKPVALGGESFCCGEEKLGTRDVAGRHRLEVESDVAASPNLQPQSFAQLISSVEIE